MNDKLDQAKNEIGEILHKYDLAGFVLLHTIDSGGIYIKVDPSYSCLFINRQKHVIGIHVDSGITGEDPVRTAERIADSLDLLEFFAEQLGQHAGNFERLLASTQRELQERYGSKS